MNGVLIIENEDLIVLSLRAIIEQLDPGIDIVETKNFQDAISLLSAHHFEMVILQTLADHGSGIRMLEEIRSRDPRVAILVCSGGDERLQAKRFLLRGANGFMVKSATRQEIMTAISMVLKGKRYVSQQIHADILSRHLPVEKYRRALTKREDQVMHLTLQGKSTSEIANALSVHQNLVCALSEEVLRKMQVNSVVDLLNIAGKRPAAELARKVFQSAEGDSGNFK